MLHGRHLSDALASVLCFLARGGNGRPSNWKKSGSRQYIHRIPMDSGFISDSEHFPCFY